MRNYRENDTQLEEEIPPPPSLPLRAVIKIRLNSFLSNVKYLLTPKSKLFESTFKAYGPRSITSDDPYERGVELALLAGVALYLPMLIQRTFTGVIESDSVNAISAKRRDIYFIAITKGVIRELHTKIPYVCELMEIPDQWREKVEGILIMCSLLFISGHETAHITLGHLDDEFQPGFRRQETSFRSEANHTSQHFNERESYLEEALADKIGVELLIIHLGKYPHLNEKLELYQDELSWMLHTIGVKKTIGLLEFSVSLVIASIDQGWVEPEPDQNSSHPNPFIRLLLTVSHVRNAIALIADSQYGIEYSVEQDEAVFNKLLVPSLITLYPHVSRYFESTTEEFSEQWRKLDEAIRPQFDEWNDTWDNPFLNAIRAGERLPDIE